jgi:predicted phage terminase large subunit-like protein
MLQSKTYSPEPSGSAPRLPPDALLQDGLFHFARADFWCFVELMFPVLHAGSKIIFSPYLELIASSLQRVEQGKYKRVLINLPPRHMKSVITSVLYPAWRLGREPADKFICISYSDDLAHDLSNSTRLVMRSPLYKKLFPATQLQKSSEDHIRTTKGGYRYATSVGSTITGFGADEIIIDDPLQPEDASSETKTQAYRSWLGSSVLTRFNDQTRGVLILVMHRLAPNDPSAHFEPTADLVLRLPLIAEVDEKAYSFNGRKIYSRKAGELLNPAQLDLPAIDRLRRMLPSHVFSSQYQQRPTLGGSGMYSVDKWPRYDAEKPPKFELAIHSWDVGATVSGNASVCTVWGLCKNAQEKDAIYLLNIIRLRIELPELLAAIKTANQRDRPALIVIDERGVGLGTFQFLHRDGFRHVVGSTATSDVLEREGQLGVRPSASKIDRFGKTIHMIADGRVLIPKRAPWLERFLAEVAGFPNLVDKDQVDSMTQVAGALDRVIFLARHRKSRQNDST